MCEIVFQEDYIAIGSNGPLHLTGGSNGHSCSRAPALGSNGFHLLHDVHTILYFPKDNVLAIQPRGNDGRDKELSCVS